MMEDLLKKVTEVEKEGGFFGAHRRMEGLVAEKDLLSLGDAVISMYEDLKKEDFDKADVMEFIQQHVQLVLKDM